MADEVILERIEGILLMKLLLSCSYLLGVS